MRLEAMNRQGQRTDLTSVPSAQKLKGKTSRELLSEQVGESQDQIRRYIRLTNLIRELMDMVDESELSFKAKIFRAFRRFSLQGKKAFLSQNLTTCERL